MNHTYSLLLLVLLSSQNIDAGHEELTNSGEIVCTIPYGNLGYSFLNIKLTTPAIEILKLNVEKFPQSANVYDSLGEAYMNAGDKERAIENYEESLKLNPNNAGGMENLKKLKGEK